MLFCSLLFYLPPSTEAPLQFAPPASWQHAALAVCREDNKLSTKTETVLQSSKQRLDQHFCM